MIGTAAGVWVRRTLKTARWVIVATLGVVILTVIALQFSAVQDAIARQLVASITGKTHSRIEIGAVRIALTHSVVLEDIYVESLQRDTLLHIQTLAADIDLLGLLSNDITLRHLRIDSLTAHVSRTAPDSIFNFDFLLKALGTDRPADTGAVASSSPGWNVSLGSVTLNGMNATYNDQVDGLDLRLHLGSLGASINVFDLEKRQFIIDDLSLENATVRYDVRGEPEVHGLDPNHLRMDDLTLRAGDIVVGDTRIAADIQHASFREHAGLEVRELSGGFIADSVHAQLTDVTLETGASLLHQDLLLTYASITELTDSPGNVEVSARTRESYLDASELHKLWPSLPLAHVPEGTIRFGLAVSGRVRDLQIEHLQMGAGNASTVDLSGSIRGLPDVATASYDIDLKELSTGRKDLHALLGDSLLPANLVMPIAMHMNGSFHGTPSNFSAAAALETSIGNLQAHVAFNTTRRDSAHSPHWQADVMTEGLNAGALFTDAEILGPVSLKASAAGTGLHMADIEARVDAEVDRVRLNGVELRQLSVHGSAGSQMFSGTAEMRDSSLAFTFDGTVNTSEERPAYRFTLDVKGADLQRLRLTADDIRIAGKLSADLTGRNVDDINGRVGVRHVTVMKNRKRFRLDSLMVTAANADDGSHLRIESPILTGAFDGTISPGDLPEVLRHHVSRYFTLHEPALPAVSRAQAFSFSLSLRDPAIISEVFFPQLDGLGPGDFTGTYNSEDKLLHLHVNVRSASYAGIDLDSLSLEVMSDVRQLRSTLRVALMTDATLRVTDVQFSAIAEVDSITMSLQSADGQGTPQLFLAGICNSVQDGFRFRFRPEGVVFRDTVWHVPDDHYILFGSGHVIAHNVVLRGGTQSVSVNSPDKNIPFPPLRIDFADCDLATFSRVVERDSGLVGGVVNGSIVLLGLAGEPAFTSDITVKQFAFAQHMIGDITLRAANRTAGTYDVGVDIGGNGNDIAIRGSYRNTDGPNTLDLRCECRQGNLASFEPLTFGTVQRMSGSINGVVHLRGTLRNPTVAGDLHFANAALSPTILGSLLHVNDGRIMFDEKGMHVGSIELTDTLGRKAVLSGNLLTDDYRDFGYDLRLHVDHFLVMNTAARRDGQYYGVIFLDGDIVIGGDVAKPVVDMQARVGKGTDIAVLLPASGSDLERRFGIVRFVDVRHPADPIMSRSKPGSTRTRNLSGVRPSAVTLTGNVEVDKEARLRILIDPIAGDSLVVRGQGTFSIGMDQGGALAITGRYEILDGSYQLSFGELLRREFVIDKGSSLTWVGSVTDATVDITAIYTVKASVLDLVQDQLTGLSQEERNKYKQEFPVQVYLMMDGKLMEPNIRLRLDLSPAQRGALGGALYAKLTELNGHESELNRQVFALLVLGRFISSDPLASVSDGEGLTGLARSSVSQILTHQLNRLSAGMISGIDLNVGVESFRDYSSGIPGGRTQLQLGLTKQLFNERVVVQIGGNVDLEGEWSRRNSLNSFAGDIKVGYKMTEDGRWQLQVFRSNTNGDALEGDLVETGVGIVFTIDYDKLFGLTLTPVRNSVAGR